MFINIKQKEGYDYEITQVNFKGELIENGTVTISFDELPDEIKELINIGAYTKEEALSLIDGIDNYLDTIYIEWEE